MLDPIGAYQDVLELYLSYLDTTYRLRRKDLTEERYRLLKKPGSLMTAPYIEPILRYKSSDIRLEACLDADVGNPLANFNRNERRAIIEMALSGLFPGKDSDGDLRRASIFPPYKHQIDMLARGVSLGQPGIVTSGTGSGKTESFLLPILAEITAEAIKWPSPSANYLNDQWWQAQSGVQLHRSAESPDRPKAVRALLLYPMNALVEDQMVRLRKMLDSPAATNVLDRHANGNRIFFGRYTSASPVPGHLIHPRQSDSKEQNKAALRTARVREALLTISDDQEKARAYDEKNINDEPTRYLFPSVDGSELITRWDMQETPPDLLVTNISMLNAMLSREVDSSIFEQTKAWLETDEDAYFSWFWMSCT